MHLLLVIFRKIVGRAVNPLQISEWGALISMIKTVRCVTIWVLARDPQILAEMGFLEGGARRRREKFGIWAPKMRIYKGESPKNETDFGDFSGGAGLETPPLVFTRF